MSLSKRIFLLCLVICGSVLVTDAQLTPHFQNWLSANGYTGYNFVRSDLGANGSYGGKSGASDTVGHGRQSAGNFYSRQLRFGARAKLDHDGLEFLHQLFSLAGL
jgi:hypothetical protein